MEDNKEKRLLNIIKILCAIVLIINAIGIIACLKEGLIRKTIISSCSEIFCILVLYYAFVGYKKPHGNLLRYLYFIFGLIAIFTEISNSLDREALINEIAIYSAVLSGSIIIYISGRLDKFEKNKVLLFLSGTLLLINRFLFSIALPKMPLLVTASRYTKLILFISLALAYVARYNEHKEAGLQDK